MRKLAVLSVLLVACGVRPPVVDGGAEDAAVPVDAGLPVFALEDGGCWSSPERISEAALGVANPVLAVDGRESAFVLWTQSSGGGRVDLLGNRFGADAGWGRPQVLAGDAGYLWGPTLAANASGLAVAVWLSGEFGTIDGPRLNLARYLPDAGGWQGPEVVSAASPLLKTDATVGIDDRGDLFVAWVAPVMANGGASLWVRRFDAAGGSWSEPRHFDVPPFQSAASAVSLAVNGSGRAVIAYLYGANDKQVRAAVSLPDGGWSDEVVGAASGFVATGVSAAVGSSGDAVIAWAQDNSMRGQWRVAASARRGERWTAPAPIDAADGGPSRGPAATVDGEGRALVAWTQGDAAHFARNDGTGWTAPFGFPLEATGESAFGVSVATNAEGLGAIAWQTNTATWASWTQETRVAAPSAVNEGYGVAAVPVQVAVTPRGTRWLVLGGRSNDAGLFVSHCP